MNNASKMKNTFSQKRDNLVERIKFALYDYFHSAAYIANKILINFNILPLCQKVLNVNQQWFDYFKDCNPPISFKSLIEKTNKNSIIDFRNDSFFKLIGVCKILKLKI